MSQSAKKILILHSVTEEFGVPQNYLDFVEAFRNFSQNEIYYLNPVQKCLTLEEIHFFDVIVIHHSIILFSEAMLPYFWRVLLRSSKIKKVLFVQDDFRQVDNVLNLINFIGINLLFTIIPDKAKEVIYPPAVIPGVKIVSILTSYVPEYFKERRAVDFESRKLDVVYRGRKSSAWYGDLVREKWIIGEKFAQDALHHGLYTDISSKEEDRIYGEKWFEFLSTSKAVLGTESSSNVIDFSGEIERKTLEHEKAFPDTTYKTLKYLYFNDVDGKIKLNILSPKIFEYASTHTLMILYEGEYSGVVTPWIHYIPLKKDHSNMDQIIPFLKDEEAWQKITDNAYNDLILSEKYSYRSFIKLFDEEVGSLLNQECWTYSVQDPKLPTDLNIRICGTVPAKKSNMQRAFKDFLRAITPPFLKTLAQRAMFLYRGFKIAIQNNKHIMWCFNSKLAGEVILFNSLLNDIEEIFKKTNILYRGKNANHYCLLHLNNKNGAFNILLDCEKELGLPPEFQNIYYPFQYSEILYKTFIKKIKMLNLDNELVLGKKV